MMGGIEEVQRAMIAVTIKGILGLSREGWLKLDVPLHQP